MFAPIYLTKNTSIDPINIGLYENHYVWIKNINALTGKQGQDKMNFCFNCLRRYSTADHTTYCSRSSPSRIEMPQSKNDLFVHFRNLRKAMKQPYVIYADFESVFEGKKHVPCGFAAYLSSTDEIQGSVKVFRGTTEKETMDAFFAHMFEMQNLIMDKLKDQNRSSWMRMIMRRSMKPPNVLIATYHSMRS